MSPHSNVSVPTNGPSVVCAPLNYTPISPQSYVHVTLLGTELMSGASGSSGQWISSIVVGSTEIGNSMHGYNNPQQIVESSPTYASYTNSSLSPITFSATLRRIGGGTANMLFFQSSKVKTCWFHIEEVQA